MNCKPGDLAYITHPSLLGKLVTVLHAAPDARTFLLPNGVRHVGRQEPGDWVIQSMGAPFEVRRTGIGPLDRNVYACTNDRWLRPIRGDGLADDTPVDIDQPQPVEAA